METLFGKMAHTFLCEIRVHSWDELRARILKGITEINTAPVVHRWKSFRNSTNRDPRAKGSDMFTFHWNDILVSAARSSVRAEDYAADRV